MTRNFKVTIHGRGSLEIPGTETERVFRQEARLDSILGQGIELYLEGRLFSIDADASIEIEVYTGASFSARPYDQGRRVKLTYVDSSGTTQTNQDKAVYAAVGVMRIWTEDTLRSDVEVVIRLKGTAGAATARRGELDLVGSFRTS